jgi:hypothetical protein
VNFKINEKKVNELVSNIYFIEEIWIESNNVYELLNLQEMIESKIITHKGLLSVENKLSELNKHFKFYIKNKLNSYRHEEKLKIIKCNGLIEELHQQIETVLYKIC